jgi:hypothetical protein
MLYTEPLDAFDLSTTVGLAVDDLTAYIYEILPEYPDQFAA